jgi:hypothetical protein
VLTHLSFWTLIFRIMSNNLTGLGLGRKAKVFCGTWNMGNAQGERVGHFLPKNGGDYDVFAIGLQESTYSVGDDNKASLHFEPCLKHLREEFASILGPDFYIVEHARRAQLQLYVFAKISLQKSISHVQKSAENTGFLHIFPNKACLLVRVRVRVRVKFILDLGLSGLNCMFVRVLFV